jgi:hypothetical protein
MSKPDPLASLRASLKAGKPNVVTSKATPTSKADPLDTLRAQIKAGKVKTVTPTPPGPVGIRGVTQR